MAKMIFDTDAIGWEQLRNGKEWLLNNGSPEAMSLATFVEYLQETAIDHGADEDLIYGTGCSDGTSFYLPFT